MWAERRIVNDKLVVHIVTTGLDGVKFTVDIMRKSTSASAQYVHAVSYNSSLQASIWPPMAP